MMRLRHEESTRKALGVLALAAPYALAFSVLHGHIGFAAGILSVVPVVAAAWFFGARVGLIAGLLTFPVNSILAYVVAGGDWYDYPLRAGAILGTAAGATVGLAIGRLRDLGIRARLAEGRVAGQYRELQRLSERLVNSQEDERKRVAMELHDGPLQTALYLLNSAAAAGSDTLLKGLVAEIRTIMTRLRPSVLDDLGLVAGLQWLLQDATDRVRVTPTLSLDGVTEEERFPVLVEVGVFRVAQEAITNAMKHSDARRLEVSLSRQGGSLVLAVADDGNGFAPHSAKEQGLGIPGMRERVRELGGQLEVRAAEGQGTDVIASVPLDR